MILKLTDQEYQSLAEKFLTEYLRNGFQSLSKKDTDLLIFYLLMTHNGFSAGQNLYEIAKELKITPNRTRSLILEASLRWGQPDTAAIIRVIFNRILQEEYLETVKQQNADLIARGKIPVLLDNPIERLEFENAVKKLEAIPEYTFNRDVLIIGVETVFQLALQFGSEEIRGRIKKSDLQTAEQQLKDILTKEMKTLTFDDLKRIPGLLRSVAVSKGWDSLIKGDLFSFLGGLMSRVLGK